MPGLIRNNARLWTPGKQKPQGVPRIDWTHPLARGLIFYGFETGTGLILDLARGRPMQQVGGGPTAAPTAASEWGTGFKWNAADGRFFDSDAEIRAATAAPPFTWACALNQTANQSNAGAVAFGRTAGNGASAGGGNWYFETDVGAQTKAQACINSGGGFAGSTTYNSVANNAFLTLVCAATSAAAMTFYANGTTVGTSSGLTIQSFDTSDAIIFGGNSAAGSSQAFVGMVFYGAFWNRALSADEALLLHNDPYCFLAPAEPEWPVLKSAGASTYSVTQAETGSAADTPSAIGTFGVTAAESGSAASVQSSTATLPSSVAETGSAADTVTGGSPYSVSVTETGTATDAPAALMVALGTVAEAGTAADSPSSAAVYPSTVTESGTAADAASNGQIFAATLSEAGTAADTSSSGLTALATVAESAIAADTESAGLVGASSVTEAATALESPSSVATMAAGVVEAGSAADTQSSAIVQVYNVAIIEAATALDGIASTIRHGLSVTPAPSNASITVSAAPSRPALTVSPTSAGSVTVTPAPARSGITVTPVTSRPTIDVVGL